MAMCKCLRDTMQAAVQGGAHVCAAAFGGCRRGECLGIKAVSDVIVD